MHPTARKLADQIRDSHSLEATIEELPRGTKMADDVAAAAGCGIAQTVKNIMMRAGNETVVVFTSDANRVDEASLGSELDAEQGSIRSANPSEVKAATGRDIDSTPPIYHTIDCPALAGPMFESFDQIWAVVGTPEAALQLMPGDLRAPFAPWPVDVFE